MKPTVRTVSKGDGLKKLKKELVPGKYAVRIGLPDNGQAAEGDLTLAELGTILEYGTATIPPRPFLENGVRIAKDKIAQVSEKLLASIVKGKRTITEGLEVIGALAVSAVQENIAQGDFAPNAQSTIDRKGSSRPLIDTGRLRQSITFLVVGKEAK